MPVSKGSSPGAVSTSPGARPSPPAASVSSPLLSSLSGTFSLLRRIVPPLCVSNLQRLPQGPACLPPHPDLHCRRTGSLGVCRTWSGPVSAICSAIVRDLKLSKKQCLPACLQSQQMTSRGQVLLGSPAGSCDRCGEGWLPLEINT